MATAEPARAASAGLGAKAEQVPPHSTGATLLVGESGSGLSRLWAWPALGLVLAIALLLRLWGVRQGLPYVYNIDEAGHFVPKAVAMSAHGLNPHYFVNPPALTYVLHLVFVVWFGGAHGVIREYQLHPDQVFLAARVTVALLGAGAVWLLYLLGTRLFDRRVGLLAAALETVAFLPVFYGHFALNDAATLLPLTLSLLGSAGVLRRGRMRDYALAGAGLGLACASKYTAGIAIVPLAAAIAARYLTSIDGMPAHRLPMQAVPTRPTPMHAMPARSSGRGVLGGIAIAGVGALAAFLLANPYALLDFPRFHMELIHQSSLSEEAQGKLGAPRQGGLLYYLWSLTWGLGWVPSLAAFGGAIAIWRRNARLGWFLVPASILFLAFMGLQDRYFGRWLLPIFPIACLLAAFFGLEVARARAWGRPFASVATGLVAALLLAQGLVYSVHDDAVLARADTRNLTRSWMVAHVPRGARIVLEPVVLASWIEEGAGAGARRWVKYPALQSVIAPNGMLALQSAHSVALEDYETTLSPALLGWYERQGYCWVVSGSTESGRALADPRAAPLATSYYRALASQAQVAYGISPYSRGSQPSRFNFDWTFDYYPLSYVRPGPQMTVYRLLGGRCATGG
ncbi:MAG TPA: glycosyltransferase family 39 protein [Solirubrobacteraceae bacterium]|jgi:4-amino-4-deoxy-L-arabinose transferase-like glycosyltransferase|nr:glycosyltransferase family 39 protein [Solirubrobacteraceae bacterium]